MAFIPLMDFGEIYSCVQVFLDPNVDFNRSCQGPAEACQSPHSVNLDLECISISPRAFIVENFLSDFEADAIIAFARGRVRRSGVGDAATGRESDTRTSFNAWLQWDFNEITATVSHRVMDLLRLDYRLMVNAEQMQVVHYDVGQRYEPHHDWGVGGNPASRFITVLMYLTDQERADAGGETSFPKSENGLGFKVKPVKGTAVVFYNLLEDGNGDDNALHAALPVSRGEKWLANYWIWLTFYANIFFFFHHCLLCAVGIRCDLNIDKYICIYPDVELESLLRMPWEHCRDIATELLIWCRMLYTSKPREGLFYDLIVILSFCTVYV